MWLCVSLSPSIEGHTVNGGSQSLGESMSWAILLIYFLELSKREYLYIYQISSNEHINESLVSLFAGPRVTCFVHLPFWNLVN